MQDFQNSFNPSSLQILGINIFFYIIILATTFISLATVYVVVRYSRSRGVGFFVAVIFSIVYISLVLDGISALTLLK